jgi:hypothetical protein
MDYQNKAETLGLGAVSQVQGLRFESRGLLFCRNCGNVENVVHNITGDADLLSIETRELIGDVRRRGGYFEALNSCDAKTIFIINNSLSWLIIKSRQIS